MRDLKVPFDHRIGIASRFKIILNFKFSVAFIVRRSLIHTSLGCSRGAIVGLPEDFRLMISHGTGSSQRITTITRFRKFVQAGGKPYSLNF